LASLADLINLLDKLDSLLTQFRTWIERYFQAEVDKWEALNPLTGKTITQTITPNELDYILEQLKITFKSVDDTYQQLKTELKKLPLT